MHLKGSTYSNFSIIEGTFDLEFSAESLMEVFEPICGPKEGLLQWGAVSFVDGAKERHKENVAFAHAVVLDKDCGDVGEFDACFEHLKKAGLAFFMYTTHSHRVPDKHHKGSNTTGPFDCFRVVLPTSRDVLPDEFSALVASVLEHVVQPDPSKYLKEASEVSKSTGKPPKPRGWDPAASSIAQFWYGPGCDEELVGELRWEVVEGAPLDVDRLLVLAPAKKRKKGAFKRALERLEGAPNSKMGRALERVAQALEKAGCPLDHVELDEECRSQCPACHASQDSLCVKTEGDTILLKCFASCEAADILKVLGLSFADLNAGKTDADDRAIRRAFGSERTEPYTLAELASMAPTEERWILQTSAGYFLRAPGGDYVGPVARDHVVNKARDLLAPASSAGVTLVKFTAKGGATDKTLGELMREYGQTPTAVSYSYCVTKSRLEGHTFIQKTGLPEEMEAVEDKRIGKWLEIFAGEAHEALLDWLATLLDLSRPTCAVCIAGASGAGKDLFVEGLARFWGGKSTSFQRAISRFNDALLNSPLVVANEQLVGTGDYHWNPVEALKTMVSDTSRTIEAKNVKSAQLEGALRIVLATNNRGAFDLGRQPTQSDLVALDDRILLVKPSPEAADYLVSIGGMDTTIDWVRGGGIARHVMWLSKTRQVKYGTRFIVQGRGGMSDLLSSESQGSAKVLRAILKALCGRQKDPRVCTIKNGSEVWFSQSNLIERWSIYEKSELPENMGEIIRTITSNDERRPIRTPSGLVKMRKVQLSILELAAEKEGMMDDLEQAFGLSNDIEDPSKKPS